MVRSALLAAFAAYVPAHGYVYDVFLPEYKPGCKNGGCMAWASVSDGGKYFAGGKVPAEAGNHCALPSATAGAEVRKNKVEYSFGGTWCFCAENAQATYCKRPQQRVEQLNLQLARKDVVVASFVTFESIPHEVPVAMFGDSEASMTMVNGTSAYFKTPDANREYIMHYIPFRNLQPGNQYYYKVKSGSSGCPWTDVKAFRVPADSTSDVSKIAVFGDMGHDANNNMGNLKDDYEAGLIEAVFHLGDHAYYWPRQEHGRGDAYMNVFQQVLESCPWVPIIGNHEYCANDPEAERYMNMAEGLLIGEQDGARHWTTADSALGYHLSLGMLMGSGTHGAVPSGTSKYTSVDIGLIHVVVTETQHWSSAQKDWLEKDLAAAVANRDKVPWIVVLSHFPTYFTTKKLSSDVSWEAYSGDEGEYNRSARYQTCDITGGYCETYGDWHLGMTHEFEPILLKYKVDVMGAGHNHRYESTWPMAGGQACAKSFDNPACPVYFVEGDGGVPGHSNHISALEDCGHLADWCRTYDTKQSGGYTRLTATRTTLQYDHVQNYDSKVIDAFTIVKNGGPSPPMPPPAPPPPPSPPPPPPTPGADTLKAGHSLGANQYLQSSNGAKLTVQGSDGNLVLRNKNHMPLWASSTDGNPGDSLVLQKSDGNLVLYDKSHKPLWSSGNHPGAEKVVLTDDCDLVKLHSNGNSLWHLGTKGCLDEETVV